MYVRTCMVCSLACSQSNSDGCYALVLLICKPSFDWGQLLWVDYYFGILVTIEGHVSVCVCVCVCVCVSVCV